MRMAAHLSFKYSVSRDRVSLEMWVARLADSVNFQFNRDTLSHYVIESYWERYSNFWHSPTHTQSSAHVDTNTNTHTLTQKDENKHKWKKTCIRCNLLKIPPKPIQ